MITRAALRVIAAILAPINPVRFEKLTPRPDDGTGYDGPNFSLSGIMWWDKDGRIHTRELTEEEICRSKALDELEDQQELVWPSHLETDEQQEAFVAKRTAEIMATRASAKSAP